MKNATTLQKTHHSRWILDFSTGPSGILLDPIKLEVPATAVKITHFTLKCFCCDSFAYCHYTVSYFVIFECGLTVLELNLTRDPAQCAVKILLQRFPLVIYRLQVKKEEKKDKINISALARSNARASLGFL